MDKWGLGRYRDIHGNVHYGRFRSKKGIMEPWAYFMGFRLGTVEPVRK